MHESDESMKIKFNSATLRLVTLIVGVAAAYFLTIQSIKIELTEKAESAVVETLDRRLANLEVLLKESTVSREQFHLFSKSIESRLGRIEFYLIDQSGEKIGKK